MLFWNRLTSSLRGSRGPQGEGYTKYGITVECCIGISRMWSTTKKKCPKWEFILQASASQLSLWGPADSSYLCSFTVYLNQTIKNDQLRTRGTGLLRAGVQQKYRLSGDPRGSRFDKPDIQKPKRWRDYILFQLLATMQRWCLSDIIFNRYSKNKLNIIEIFFFPCIPACLKELLTMWIKPYSYPCS